MAWYCRFHSQMRCQIIGDSDDAIDGVMEQNVEAISIWVGMGNIPLFCVRGCCSIDDIGFCFKRKFPIESQLKNDS